MPVTTTLICPTEWHLMNPDCAIGNVRAAQLFYEKQIAFALMPPILVAVLFGAWRCIARVKREDWRARTEPTDVTPKDKWVVSVCAVLYLL